MQLRILPAALAVAFTAPSPLLAEGAEQALSYEAEGGCYCTDTLRARSDEFPTLETGAGAMDLATLCERVGTGPALEQREGRYNHAVFADPQCGHGISGSEVNSSAALCELWPESMQPGCPSVGARWILPVQPRVTRLKPRWVDPNAMRVAAESAPEAERVADVPVESAATVAPEIESGQIVQDTRAQVAQPKSRVVNQTVAPLAVARPITIETRQYTLEQYEADNSPAGPVELTESEGASETEVEPAAEVVAETNLDVADREASADSTVAVDSSADALNDNAEIDATSESSHSAALRVPKRPESTGPNQVHNFSYVDARPISFDFGGAGVLLGVGHAISGGPIFVQAEGSAVEGYQEGRVGVGIDILADRVERTSVALVAGYEYGNFSDIQGLGITTTMDSHGLFTAVAARAQLMPRTELRFGVGYSSFFEGDEHVFGGLLYQVTPRLGIQSDVELGDNDNINLGLRYFY